MLEEKYLVQIGNDFYEIPDEVLDDIRSSEREMIVDFIRQIENIYEVGEELALMIEELQHYEDEEIH